MRKQQIFDSHEIMKFAGNLEGGEGQERKSLKVAHNKQLDKALYTWFISAKISFVFGALIFIFSIIQIIVRIVEV